MVKNFLTSHTYLSNYGFYMGTGTCPWFWICFENHLKCLSNLTFP